MAWGVARWGHPEGHVGLHVADILEEIGHRDPARADLRFIAIVHDSQKFRVDLHGPRTKENDHAWLAREVAAGLTAVLNTLQGAAAPEDDRTFLLARRAANAG